MSPTWIEKIVGVRTERREYRAAMRRLKALPAPYREPALAMHRYISLTGAVVDGPAIVAMMRDLADLWERAALDETPIDSIGGDDPAAFADSFVAAFGGRRWDHAERERLIRAFAH